ncbi:hypothetical protein FRAHR75_770026 [Frankia sp. Hr75.2]|nr:hypothetical protein FRAHR75_770026 [Frankia sp. Hr75.2]
MPPAGERGSAGGGDGAGSPGELMGAYRAAASELAGLYEAGVRLEVAFDTLIGPWAEVLWTAGGAELGDLVDEEALARGLGMADGYALGSIAGRVDRRGDVTVLVTPLRPVLDAIRAGVRDTGEFSDVARRWVEDAHAVEPVLWPVDEETVRRVGSVWDPLGPRLTFAKRG